MRVISIGLIVLSIGTGIAIFTIMRMVNGAPLYQQTEVPGTIQIKIVEPGRYYLWDNHRTIFNDQRIEYSADCPVDAEIHVSDESDTDVEFVKDTSQSWSIGNHEKTSVGYLKIDKPTQLKIEVGNIDQDRIFSVSNQTLQEELWMRLNGFGSGVAISLVGLLLFVIGIFIPRAKPKHIEA